MNGATRCISFDRLWWLWKRLTKCTAWKRKGVLRTSHPHAGAEEKEGRNQERNA